MLKEIPCCPFCMSKNASKAFNATDIREEVFEYYLCNHCESTYLWPQPETGELEEAYDAGYYGKEENKFSFPGVEAVLNRFRHKRARTLSKLLKGQGRILDIGCGNGNFLHKLNQLGAFELYGSELAGPAAERAKKYPEINLSLSGEFHEKVEDGSLDAVSMFHVLEHIPQPLALISRIEKSLKPGGYFFVSFPNFQGWQAQCFGPDWLHLDPPRHLCFFHPKSFTETLNKHGLQLIRKTSLSVEQNPFGAVQSLLNKMSNKRDLLFESMKGNKAYLQGSSKMQIRLHQLFFAISFPVFVVTDLLAGIWSKGATITYIFQKQDLSNNA